METRYYRNKDGWHGSTRVDLQANDRTLELGTRRWQDGRLMTTASVFTERNGSRIHVMGMGGPGGDFFQTVEAARPARVTEKVVREQHERVLGDLPAIRIRIAEFYEAKDHAKHDELRNKAIAAVAQPA